VDIVLVGIGGFAGAATRRMLDRPLYEVLVRRLRGRGIRGVSVYRGIERYGRSSRVHTTRILAMSVTLERLEVVVYRAKDG
jgi:PII-like signaling protein